MPRIAAIRGLRYTRRAGEIEALVSPPFDAIDEARRKDLVSRSEHNVAAVTLPAGAGEARYALAKDTFRRWRKEGALKADPEPSVYVLTQAFSLPDGREVVRSGFIAYVRIDDGDEGMVLAHERTSPVPVEDRLKLTAAVSAQLEPVFLVFADQEATARSVMASASTSPPLEVLETPDGVTHRLHRLFDRDALSALGDAMRHQQAIIADGHHRYMASLAYRDRVGKERPGPHRYFLAFLCPLEDEGLIVKPTHRLLHSTPGFDAKELLENAAPWFEVTSIDADVRQPEGRSTLLRAVAGAGENTTAFGLVLSGGDSHVLSLRAGVEPPGLPEEPWLRRLDAAVLHGAVLGGLIGLSEESLEGLDHVFYIESTTEAFIRLLGARSAEEGQALFVMNPTPIEQVRAVAAMGSRMPQKSTRFFPKVPSGLVFGSLEEDEAILEL